MRSKKSLLTEQTALVWDAPGLIAGVDEAGRGPLAGPVVAAAVTVVAAPAVLKVVLGEVLEPPARGQKVVGAVIVEIFCESFLF